MPQLRFGVKSCVSSHPVSLPSLRARRPEGFLSRPRQEKVRRPPLSISPFVRGAPRSFRPTFPIEQRSLSPSFPFPKSAGGGIGFSLSSVKPRTRAALRAIDDGHGHSSSLEGEKHDEERERRAISREAECFLTQNREKWRRGGRGGAGALLPLSVPLAAAASTPPLPPSKVS